MALSFWLNTALQEPILVDDRISHVQASQLGWYIRRPHLERPLTWAIYIKPQRIIRHIYSRARHIIQYDGGLGSTIVLKLSPEP
jgi:hypothetical protein